MTKDTDQTTALVALLGMSPAVVTETLWALAEEGTIPDHIDIVTTKKGWEGLEKAMAPSAKDGVWQRFTEAMRAAFPHVPNANRLRTINLCPILLEDAAQNEMEDLRGVEEHLLVADQMLKLLKSRIKDHARVFASIAGGRKTMGALLFSCMSLVGRKQDRILHVLMNEPYDLRLEPPFFYPSDTSHKRIEPDGTVTLHHGMAAKISLFEVPFVHLSNLYAGPFGQRGSLDYAKLVKLVDQQIEVKRIELDLDADEPLRINGTPLPVNAAEALALWLHWTHAAAPGDHGEAMAELKRRAAKVPLAGRPLWLRKEKGLEAGKGRFCTMDDPKALEQEWSRTISDLRKRKLGKVLTEEDRQAILPKRNGQPVPSLGQKIECRPPNNPVLRNLLKGYGID